jgi:membrane associated rhomboid family serine protease
MSYQEFRPSRFQILPPVVKNILIISGILFLATELLKLKSGIDLTDHLGLHYYSAELFKPYQFITYIFMHGDLSHIFFNMFAVWTFGSVLENVWGSKRFLVFYLITGLGAALAQYIVFYFDISSFDQDVNALLQSSDIEKFTSFFNNGGLKGRITSATVGQYNSFVEEYNLALTQDVNQAVFLAKEFLSSIQQHYINAHVVVGASGSLFGLLGAFGLMFPNTVLYMMFIPIPIKAKYFVAIYGAIELFSGISQFSGDNVAHFAHLGGLAVGLVIVLIWRKNRTNFY